jgi:NAD(P)-dependent dehydrogenase (short-subunit alcohol dehydrogenase family)
MSWLQLTGKTAVVTGAASGIGRAVAYGLVDAGCRVVLGDADTIGVEEVARELKGKAEFVTCNVASKSQVERLIQTGGNEASILVNCAGITRDAFITKMSEQDYDDVLNVNLKGTFLTCQEFLSLDRGLQGGSIINVGSIVSEQGNIGQANYAASKGGVLGLTKAIAKEVAYRRIRVNAVLPGFINTKMAQAVPAPILNAIEKKIPLGRFGEPNDIANLVLFLASDRSAYITGECIECSGMLAL